MPRARTNRLFPLLLLPVLLAAWSAKGSPTPAPEPPGSAVPEAKAPASIFDDTDGAGRIAFVCDASGSMINKMASLKDQLTKALAALTPHQLFGIIFLQDHLPERSSEKLVPATAEHLRKAATFLEGITTTGTTDPIPGIEAAFKIEPEVIYLLTDGDFPDNDAVLKKIRELDKDKKVKVYTIAFVNQNDTDTDFIKLLKTIAEETGGKYKHVNEGDL